MILQEMLSLLAALRDAMAEIFLGFLICLVVQISLTLVVAVLWHRFNKLPAQQFAREQEEAVPFMEQGGEITLRGTRFSVSPEARERFLREVEFQKWKVDMLGKDAL